MENAKKSRWFDILILFLIISFHSWNNYVWLSEHAACNFQRANHELDYLAQAIISNYIIRDELPYYPPNQPNASKLKSLNNLMFTGGGSLSFIYTISSGLSNTDPSNMRMINILYLSILILLIYAIGRKLYNRKVGLLSSFFVSFFPFIFGISRIWTPDLMQIAMVLLVIYSLLITDKLNSRKYCLLFGFIVGVALLTKITISLFLIGPIGYYVFISFKEEMRFSRRKLLNILLASLVMAGTLFIFAPYAFFNIPRLLNHLYFISQVNTLVYHLSVPSFIMMTLIKVQLLPIFFILFLLSFIYYFKKKHKNYLLGIWILIPFFLGTLFPLSFRFMTPILPAIAIISSVSLLTIKNIRLKKMLLLFFILFAVFQFFIMSYKFDSLYKINDNFLISKGPNLNELSDISGLNNLSILILDSSYINNPPIKKECEIKDILKTIEYNSIGDPSVVISPIAMPSGPYIYHIYLAKRFNFLIVDNLDGTYYENFDLIDFVVIYSDFNPNDFKVSMPPGYLNELSKKYTFFIENKNKFEHLKEFELLDGSLMVLYKRKR